MTTDRNRGRGTRPPPGASNRVGIVEGWEIRRSRRRTPRGGALKGAVFVLLAVVLLGAGGWILARPVIGSAVTGLFQDNPGIIRLPIVGDLLAAELVDRLDRPAAAEGSDVRLTIDEGETIEAIEEELTELGLLQDPVAFHYLVVNDRVDQLIVAGTYTMSTSMSPRQVVERLAGSPDPPPKVTTIAIRDGLRIDQVAGLLQLMKEEDGLEIDVSEFLALANDPPETLMEDYPFLRTIPADHSLEGYLKGGTWEIRLDVTAEELVRELLENWDDEYGDVVSQARKKNLDFYDVLRVASIVERETPRDGEMARVAGVYWNRLDERTAGDTAGFLNADPTVIYGADSVALEDMPLGEWPSHVFWDALDESMSEVTLPPRLASFQTYQNSGPAGLADRDAIARSAGGRARARPQEAVPVLRRVPRRGQAHVRQDPLAAEPQHRQVRLAPVGVATTAGPSPAQRHAWLAADHAARPARLERLRARLAADGLDAYFGTRPENSRYLTGFELGDGEEKVSGSSGRFLVSADETVVLADSRYRLQAEEQCPDDTGRADQRRCRPPVARAGREPSADHGRHRLRSGPAHRCRSRVRQPRAVDAAR